MELIGSKILSTTKPNYLTLLQQVDELLIFSIKPSNAIEDTQKISQIETIFNNITENIERISNQMSFQKKTMFIITILNTIMRISAMNGSDLIISRDPFQLVFQKLNNCIRNIIRNEDSLRMCATDMLDSMFFNLVKGGFVDICFKRLLSNTTVLFRGKISVLTR